MLYLYRPGSYARRIAERLNVTVIGATGQRVERDNQFSPSVNWGCGPEIARRLGFINTAMNGDISTAVSKWRTFEAFDRARIPHPEVTKDATTPDASGTPFYARGQYLGRRDGLSGGAGIVVYPAGRRPYYGSHSFYSMVIPKRNEFRIHVLNGRVITEQIKYMMRGSKSTLIRSYDNGARYSPKSLEHEMTSAAAHLAREIAIDAVKACGLAFGAVDMIYSKDEKLYVLEVNTAPGVTPGQDELPPRWDMPRTFEAYVEAFRKLIQGGSS